MRFDALFDRRDAVCAAKIRALPTIGVSRSLRSGLTMAERDDAFCIDPEPCALHRSHLH